MKRYCKKIDVTNVSFIVDCINECLGNKWERNDVAKLFARYMKIPKKQVQYYIMSGQRELLQPVILQIATEMSESIKSRNIQLPEIRYMERKDRSSSKMRIIGVQTITHQFYEYVAVNATKEMFYKKIGVYQCASIPGRGQSYGKKAIQKWLSKDQEGTRYAFKGDVRKCYPSVNRDILKKFLTRDIKNNTLLYLLFTLIDAYDVGLSIGSHLAQWLCNYYLSYAYHYISERLFTTRNSKRKGAVQRVRLISHVIFYMDDIYIFSSNKKYLWEAARLTMAYFKDVLDLEIKPDYRVFAVEYTDKKGKKRGSFVDMMGFRFYRDKTTIRRSIFIKARRKALNFKRRYKKGGFIYLGYAQSYISYLGWIKNTNMYKFQQRYEITRWADISKHQVSHFTRKTNMVKKNKIKKMEERYNVKSI